MARRCCGSMGLTRRRGSSVRRSPGSVQRRCRGKGVPCWRAVIPRRTRTPSPVAPVYAVTDPDARCLARFQGTDACGFAVKDMGTWTSLYYGGLSLSEEAIRQAAAIAGAHVFADGNDVLIGRAGLYRPVCPLRGGQDPAPARPLYGLRRGRPPIVRAGIGV